MKLNKPVEPIYTHEGTKAAHTRPEEALRRSVLTCLLWEDNFYEGGQSTAARIASLSEQVSVEFLCTLAVEARTRYNLRAVPLWLVRLAVGKHSQAADKQQRQQEGTLIADALRDVIQRPDELTEFLAIYWKDKKTPLAAAVKKGLARAFGKFNAYSLAKYNQTDKAIKLRDVLFLCHAKPPNTEIAAVWKKLIEGTLESPDTWEVGLSAQGNKRETFTRLLEEGKLGALALLRNLRNMQQAGVSEELIKKGIWTMKTERVLPFRFITAARYAPQLEPDLEVAMLKCMAGAPKLAGTTALVVDTSPSMWGTKVSEKSEMDRFEAAAALAILTREVCGKVNVYAFNEIGHRVPARHGFALRDVLATTKGGYSRGGLAVEMANKDGYDRIIVLTDGQWHAMHGEKANRWAGLMGAAPKMSPAPLTTKAYLLNVDVYHNLVALDGGWQVISGWSERVLDYILAYEEEE